MFDPDFFTIDQAKKMNIWPPSELIANGLYPYIKRMKEDKVTIIEVGVLKGENIYRFLELDKENNKIAHIHGHTISCPKEYNEIRATNLKDVGFDKVTLSMGPEKVDVVCIDYRALLDTVLKSYYHNVKVGGYISGNNYSNPDVRNAIKQFRSDNKIGSPILLAKETWFWKKERDL